jgi:hypothetical protein
LLAYDGRKPVLSKVLYQKSILRLHAQGRVSADV